MRLGAPTVGVTPRASDRRYTSHEVLQAEAAVLRAAAAGHGKHVAQVPAVDPELIAGLGVDQQAAVTKLTTGGDFVVVLTAPAGARKTTTLGTASRIWRFHHEWEAAASLRLREGDASVIGVYADAGRLHTVPDPDVATAAVFAHWQKARADGAEVMMLARTRDDVDQLNALAKTAAQTAGASHGPQVVVGDKSFQAGDVIRTRRNDRQLPLGETHVRNGDRYTILATGQDGGLLVDDHAGRGATMLPPGYVAQHVEHGWASTIDGAQGATTDVAILLVRPGIDREHLYVGLTRGREENHVYVARSVDEDHEHPTTSDSGARQLLEAALARSGSNDAAHTLLDRANAANRPALLVPSAAAIQTAAAEEAAARGRRLATQQIIDQHRRAERGTGRGVGL